ncbi:hypothetical protein CMO94_04375 [Candidatus Woesearchaeota archaeon]|jgi:hypothetical protein|nr:hypothetical protein [Candidatus Woesearchaeota archaeon]|tara:strand:- start:847 stop:1353 length:507 start_codon:yes stop_codon:yes gene_type:complete
MAELSDLIVRYNRFQELEPVSTLDQIRHNSEARIKGTLADFYPSESIVPVPMLESRKEVWNGKISIGLVLQGSEKPISFAAHYVGEDGKIKYNRFKDFLEGIGKEDELEVVIKKRGGTKQYSTLYMMIGNGRYFMRGSGRTDYLDELRGSILKTILEASRVKNFWKIK